jgi:NAD(P)-dependent dehydrogenase (short-subunit alcohol dehydrogenase family)
VNVKLISVYLTKPQFSYSATKTANASLAHNTAFIYAENRVRLHTIVPGPIDTPLIKMLEGKYTASGFEGYCKMRDKQVAMGNMVTAWDADRATLFASEEATHISETDTDYWKDLTMFR